MTVSNEHPITQVLPLVIMSGELQARTPEGGSITLKIRSTTRCSMTFDPVTLALTIESFDFDIGES